MNPCKSQPEDQKSEASKVPESVRPGEDGKGHSLSSESEGGAGFPNTSLHPSIASPTDKSDEHIDTPRCNGLESNPLDSFDYRAWATLARQLERKLAEEKEERADWARRFLLDGVTPWEWMNRALAARSASKPTERIGTYIKNAEAANVRLVVDGEEWTLEPEQTLHISHSFAPSSTESHVSETYSANMSNRHIWDELLQAAGDVKYKSQRLKDAIDAAKEALPSSTMPTEDQVRIAAGILAITPLIDAPKLGQQEWMGLARHILESAGVAAPSAIEPSILKDAERYRWLRAGDNPNLGYQLDEACDKAIRERTQRTETKASK